MQFHLIVDPILFEFPSDWESDRGEWRVSISREGDIIGQYEMGPEIYAPRGSLERVINGLRINWGRHSVAIAYGFVSQDVLKNHFQGLFYSTDKDGDEVYFRFYDPRVMREYLLSCHIQLAKYFFGPLRVFACEDEDPQFTLLLSLKDNNSVRKDRILTNDLFKLIAKGDVPPHLKR